MEGAGEVYPKPAFMSDWFVKGFVNLTFHKGTCWGELPKGGISTC